MERTAREAPYRAVSNNDFANVGYDVGKSHVTTTEVFGRFSMADVPSAKALVLQSRDAIELVSSKWRIAILHVLTSGPVRTKVVQQAMHKVSPKVLTETLRGLERDGLIERRVRAVVPPHVEYALTEMGESVIEPLSGLCHWAEAHATNRDEARRRFDESHKTKKPR